MLFGLKKVLKNISNTNKSASGNEVLLQLLILRISTGWQNPVNDIEFPYSLLLNIRQRWEFIIKSLYFLCLLLLFHIWDSQIRKRIRLKLSSQVNTITKRNAQVLHQLVITHSSSYNNWAYLETVNRRIDQHSFGQIEGLNSDNETALNRL